MKAAARDALARNDTKYTAVDGARVLKEAVVAKLKRDNALDYRPDQVLISNGAKQSCYNACLALLDPGDEVIILAAVLGVVSRHGRARRRDAGDRAVDGRARLQDLGRTSSRLRSRRARVF